MALGLYKSCAYGQKANSARSLCCDAVCRLNVQKLEKMARSGSGLSCMLAYNSADPESREPVLQHAMYYRLYYRSWFAGRKTYARHVPRRGATAGLRDKLIWFARYKMPIQN
jgi:hypothetical protein